MKFKFTTYGVKRHNLAPDLVDRVFDGPPMHTGTLAGFDLRTRKLAKQVLNLPRLDAMDEEEKRVLYCALTVQDADGSILGNKMALLQELTLPDFEIAPHVVEELDQDGDCANCSLTIDATVHLGLAPELEVPPTGESQTTETES
jgi:hypothetical protein